MPSTIRWACPTELTAEEKRVAQALHRIGKFYVFLREIRAELFDEAFQAELAAIYQPRGTAPVPPALLAMVTLLQAYDQLGDAEAVVTAQLDPRWQLALGCVGTKKAPFSQGVLVKFRGRMIAHDLDRKLLARTIELAKRTGKFGWQHLQAALDSSPLLGAGRIEDTWNLIGRALNAVVTCAAKAVDRPRAQVIAEAELTLVDRSSLKAALDIDWDDPAAQAAALAQLLTEVERMERWVAAQPATPQASPALHDAVTALRAVLTQDLEPDPTGGRRILRGVAKGRQPSLGDRDMRHGRKSRSRPFTGYKRHIVKLVEPDLIVEAVARPANEPEHATLATLTTEVARHGPLTEVWMDRGYLGSPEIPTLHARGVALHVKPWTARNGERFPKHAFRIRLIDGIGRSDSVDSTRSRDGAIRRGDVSSVCPAQCLHHGREWAFNLAAPAGSLAPGPAHNDAHARRPRCAAPPHHSRALVGAARSHSRGRRRGIKGRARTRSIPDGAPPSPICKVLRASNAPHEFT